MNKRLLPLIRMSEDKMAFSLDDASQLLPTRQDTLLSLVDKHIARRKAGITSHPLAYGEVDLQSPETKAVQLSSLADLVEKCIQQRQSRKLWETASEAPAALLQKS